MVPCHLQHLQVPDLELPLHGRVLISTPGHDDAYRVASFFEFLLHAGKPTRARPARAPWQTFAEGLPLDPGVFPWLGSRGKL